MNLLRASAFSQAGASSRDTVTRLQRAGMELKVISVCRDLEASRKEHVSFPAPVPVKWLRAGHIQEDLMTSANS